MGCGHSLKANTRNVGRCRFVGIGEVRHNEIEKEVWFPDKWVYRQSLLHGDCYSFSEIFYCVNCINRFIFGS